MRDHPLWERFRDALGCHGNHPVAIEMALGDWMALAGTMQLALRHPAMQRSTDRTAELSRAFVQSCADRFRELDPVFAEVIDAAWAGE